MHYMHPLCMYTSPTPPLSSISGSVPGSNLCSIGPYLYVVTNSVATGASSTGSGGNCLHMLAEFTCASLVPRPIAVVGFLGSRLHVHMRAYFLKNGVLCMAATSVWWNILKSCEWAVTKRYGSRSPHRESTDSLITELISNDPTWDFNTHLE